MNEAQRRWRKRSFKEAQKQYAFEEYLKQYDRECAALLLKDDQEYAAKIIREMREVEAELRRGDRSAVVQA